MDQIEPVQIRIVQDLQSENRESGLEEAGKRHVRGPQSPQLRGFKGLQSGWYYSGHSNIHPNPDRDQHLQRLWSAMSLLTMCQTWFLVEVG